MTKEDIKQLIRETFYETRIYGDPNRTSDEYELTPEEIAALRNMDHNQRMTFAAKKIKLARRAKGQCISGGPKCAPPPKGPYGKPGPYCQKHLESFRVARERLAKKRGSCSRCPNPPLPGKKLCQKCTDELQAIRDKAVGAKLCMRCKKVPAQPNEKGQMTKFCRACMGAKVERNKQVKNRRQGWQQYAKDVEAAALARRVKNLGIQEYAIKGSVPDEPQGGSPFPSELQRFIDVLKDEAKKHGYGSVNELAALVSVDKGGDRVWTIINILHRQIALRFSTKQKKWMLLKRDETSLLRPGTEMAYARHWIDGF